MTKDSERYCKKVIALNDAIQQAKRVRASIEELGNSIIRIPIHNHESDTEESKKIIAWRNKFLDWDFELVKIDDFIRRLEWDLQDVLKTKMKEG